MNTHRSIPRSRLRFVSAARHRTRPLCLLSLTLAFAGLSFSCTRTVRKSGVRDLQAGAPALKRMQLKYSFVFIGSSGKSYPIYMNGILEVGETLKDGVWNSVIDSDGGLIAATNETKTLKPDKNLQLKSAQAAGDSAPSASPVGTPPADPAVMVFTSGNPELGRGLSLTLQKVVAGGVPTWKAVSLKYFGYEAQIEDSFLSDQLPASAAQP